MRSRAGQRMPVWLQVIVMVVCATAMVIAADAENYCGEAMHRGHRPGLTGSCASLTKPRRRLMLRFKPSHLMLLLGLIAPVCASAHLCIRVNGGFGNGGTSFIGKGFGCRRRDPADRGRALRRPLPASS